MNKSIVMKISYCVLSLLVVAAIVINNITVPVLASEVESLPVVDVDVVGSYDSGNVYVECNGVKYSIPRDTVCYSMISGAYPSSVPYTFESCSVGADCPVSYWYSPSNNCVIVVTSARMGFNENVSSVKGYEYCHVVRSFANSQFNVVAEEGQVYKYGICAGVYTVWDCSSNSIVVSNSFNVGSSVKSSVFTIDDSNGGEYNDLVCVFSTYEIKGFYEFNADSKVVTPEYYFDYQYLFYTERNGYVFIDSSSPLDYISNASDPTKAVLVFEDECNKHVYTSQMGNSWIVDNNVSTMYGVNYQMDCYYFYSGPGGISCYTLVYCNDEGYEEEPLVTPEYGDIKDITEYLNDFIIDGKPLPSGGRGNGLTYEEIQNLPVCDYYEFIIYGFTHEYYTRYKVVYDDGSSDYIYDLESGRWGGGSHGDRLFSYTELEKIPTIAYYLYDLNLTLDDTNLLIKTYGDALHSDIKAVFDNVTITNTYLYDIKSLLVNTNKLLSDINSPSNVGGGSSSTDITTDFLITLDDDILVSLNDIKNSIESSGGSGGSDDDTDVDIDLPDVDVDVPDDIFDIADEDLLDDLFNHNFVQSAISSIATGTLISGTFSNITSSGASSGVVWLNSAVSSIYLANNKVAAVLILGVTMSVVGLVVRKGV